MKTFTFRLSSHFTQDEAGQDLEDTLPEVTEGAMRVYSVYICFVEVKVYELYEWTEAEWCESTLCTHTTLEQGRTTGSKKLRRSNAQAAGREQLKPKYKDILGFNRELHKRVTSCQIHSLVVYT